MPGNAGTADAGSIVGWGQSVTAYCSEKDKNGGDFAIQAEMACL